MKGESKSMDDSKYDEWAVKSAAETLVRAEEIKQDSKMMKLVSKHITKQKKAIDSIEDLRERYQEVKDDE